MFTADMAAKETCLIRVDVETRDFLVALRSYPKESINDIIMRLIDTLCEMASDESQTELNDFKK